MPRPPAYAAERRQDAESEGGIEQAKNRMFVASVRRRGVGSPEPPMRKQGDNAASNPEAARIIPRLAPGGFYEEALSPGLRMGAFMRRLYPPACAWGLL
jgi:hypothetical protein